MTMPGRIAPSAPPASPVDPAAAPAGASDGRGEPLYFGSPEGEARPLFGWLHRASAPSRLGLVLCNPFGYEAICTHRSLRHFAERAARAGFPSLRFDYDGTGDSAGDDRDPGRLAAWTRSVEWAIEALRRSAEVERVVLLGVRLGALVAALAAEERGDRGDVDSLIAIAPITSGKAYLRELRALQMTLDLRPPPAALPSAQLDEGVQEALGFALTAETKAELGKIDLPKRERPPAQAVLLLERDDLPGSDAWPDRLAAQGVAVDRRRPPGYVEMALGAEHARVPEVMLEATLDWLRARTEHAAARSAPPPKLEPALPAGPRAAATLGDGVVESAEHLEPTRRLFGILTTPAAPPERRRGLLLLNAGSVHHVGPNRLYVALARRWAGLGHAVVRLDLSGLGDSRPRPGQPENIVYTDEATDDIAEAIAFLRRQPGVTEVHALGLCSGGYNAFKAAVAGLPLDGVLLINPLTFFWKGAPAQAQGRAELEDRFEASRLARRVRNLDAWKKLLRGEVDVQATAQVLLRRVTTRTREKTVELLRRAGLRLAPTDDLERELRTVVKKQIALRFLFAEGDPGEELLRTQGGATIEELVRKGLVTVERIAGPDHTFTPLWSHPVLTRTLAAHFDGPPRR